VRGPLRFTSEGRRGARTLTLHTQPATDGLLLLDPREPVALAPHPEADRPGLKAYHLPAGAETRLALRHT
jgi:hypothetical protein